MAGLTTVLYTFPLILTDISGAHFLLVASEWNATSSGAPLQNTLPSTDPAELRKIIVRQDSLIHAFQAQLEALTIQLSSATAAAPRETPIACGELPRLALPEKFDGSADLCRRFLRQCEVFFSHQPGMYREDGTKCTFLLSLLMGKALEWASAVWDADPLIRASYSHFEEGIREVFEHPAGGKDILGQLMEIRQGSESAADYAIRFRTLAAQSEWNDAVLWAVFRAGLNPALQTEVTCHVEATSLSQFVATAIRLDNLRRQHRTGASDMASACPRVRLDCPGRGERDPEPQTPDRAAGFPGELTHWSPACLQNCLRNPVSRSCGTCSVEEVNTGAHGRLPQPYADFERVFSEERASRLPEHQDWDSAIDLLPNTSLPKGQIYPLSLPESKAMEDYIEGALAAGHIRPSMSPAATGFFFVEKKDGGLRPCIDNRGLNAIIVRYPYPLPLVPAALEQLRGAQVFTKLDLRSAYNLVCIREGDVIPFDAWAL
ncbi:hypothetical protein QTP86_016149 [Hemibagrus guttatus]|nr:hypothetical protein QTP86_016149 [Hemibagrus guttatus]